MSEKIKVGFIGLGDQGEPIARRIKTAGFPLQVWARREKSLKPLIDVGAEIAPTPLALGQACDLVGICVVNDDDVRSVVLRDGEGVLYGMKAGGVIAIHSTLLPETVIELAGIAKERNVHVLDAPVSGGRKGAEQGTMTVMIGGDTTAFERAKPVLETFATSLPHLGPVGTAQVMKLLNNNLCYANLAMGASALEIAEQLSMDTDVVMEIIKVSSGASMAFNNIIGDKNLLRKATGPSTNMSKDIGHFQNVLSKNHIVNDPLTMVSETAPERLKKLAKKWNL